MLSCVEQTGDVREERVVASSSMSSYLVREYPKLYDSSNYQADFITSDYQDDDWQLAIFFAIRFIVYVILMVIIMIGIVVIMKLLKDCDEEGVAAVGEVVTASSETSRLLPKETSSLKYGACDEQDLLESGDCSSSSSEDLYDATICVICYDSQRNCFFVPCGHCATCCACAKRIVDEGENKNCPICRRLIHKVRKLFSS